MDTIQPAEKYLHSDLTREIIAAAIEVHRRTGPLLLESVYATCLQQEFGLRSLPASREVAIPIDYKGIVIDRAFRADFVVDEKVLLEIKAVEKLEPIHDAQLLTYLKLSKLRVGLILNFNVPAMRQGVRRLVL